jgi:aspartyl-tRNA(Asn)/glutamyl-tRNA(Gln) amidotransferase subunit A
VPKWDLFEKPGFMMPFNVAGYPAISVCAGFGADGLPVAIQLVGKPFEEPNLFRVADAFEKAIPFRAQRPTMASVN